MGCNFMGFIASPISEGIFLSEICGQIVVHAEVEVELCLTCWINISAPKGSNS